MLPIEGTSPNGLQYALRLQIGSIRLSGVDRSSVGFRTLRTKHPFSMVSEVPGWIDVTIEHDWLDAQLLA